MGYDNGDKKSLKMHQEPLQYASLAVPRPFLLTGRTLDRNEARGLATMLEHLGGKTLFRHHSQVFPSFLLLHAYAHEDKSFTRLFALFQYWRFQPMQT